MHSKKFFFRFTLPFLFFYILLCLLVIIIKIHYFSSIIIEFKEQNNIPSISNNDNNKNNKKNNTTLISILVTKLTINSKDYEENLWTTKLEDMKFVDSTFDMPQLDSTMERIFNVCEKYDRVSNIQRKHFLYSPKQSTLFCWIRKVASKSFTKFFSDLRSIKIVGNHYDRVIDTLNIQSIEELSNLIDDREVFKFLAIRHPFERLVSAFRDRIENNSKYTDQAWMFVPKIFYVTRPNLFYFNKTMNPIEKIFNTNNRRLIMVPTFKEFIIWLLKQPEAADDPHWDQYYSHCSVCQVSFDYVLKMDNYSSKDIDYIFANMAIDKNRWHLPHIGINPEGSTSYDITCSYLSSLSQDMFYKLYERYKVDFEMFEYDYRIYQNCVKN